ncbi:hypothetical protein [Halobacillus sp. H74]|uniref:hypothetical protein n=1 Tax=Halobacillus sp. H74 TaxID=3457436 RepID=UPI003FCDBAFA
MTCVDVLVRFNTEEEISVTVYFREVPEEVGEEDLREIALNKLASQGYPKNLENAPYDIEPY